MNSPRILALAFGAGLLFTGRVIADQPVQAHVVSSCHVDANDAQCPVYDRVNGSLVARSGVYPYAYGPTLLFDAREGLFKMWAGVGWNGDTIAYKQASSLMALNEQPWEVVLDPDRAEAVADQEHCCDPCVLAADDGYYLYYSGAGKSDRWPAGQSYVMVAFSKDGRKFERLNGGLPIADMGKAYKPVVGYGVGQPSATLGPDGWYYMLFTYSADNQYDRPETNHLCVIRSRKPDFIEHEKVTTLSRERYACSNELVYRPETKTFVMVVNESHPARGVQVRFVSFSQAFEVLNDSHILETNLPDCVFGEGLGMLTDPQRRWLDLEVDGSAKTVTVSGATHRKRGDYPIEHIAGPMVAVVWAVDLP